MNNDFIKKLIKMEKCGEIGKHYIYGKSVKCEDCDEFDYCLNCVIKCSCGKEETHYLCKEGVEYRHFCHYEKEDGYICDKPACVKYGGIPVFSDVHEGASFHPFCKEHRPLIIKRIRDFLEKEDKKLY